MWIFNKNFKQAFDKAALKQQDVAFDLRIDPGLLSKVLNGKLRAPSWFPDRFDGYEPLGLNKDVMQEWWNQDEATDITKTKTPEAIARAAASDEVLRILAPHLTDEQKKILLAGLDDPKNVDLMLRELDS